MKRWLKEAAGWLREGWLLFFQWLAQGCELTATIFGDGFGPEEAEPDESAEPPVSDNGSRPVE